MSTQVNGSISINLLQNGDSLNTTLNATSPLYQTFKKGTTDYVPNWATMPDGDRPVIFPRSYSVMEAQVKAVTNIAWKYNNVAMTFDANGLCTAPDVAAGKVRQIDYSGAKALKMVGNVASDINNDSDTISFTGKVSASGQIIDVSAEIPLLIEEAAANLYRLFLNMTDDVIDGDETSLQMTAALYNMGAQVTSGVQYEFRRVDGTILRAKGSNPVFTISREMIDSELMVVCRAYVADEVVAHAQRQVWDSIDPYTIVCDRGSTVTQSSGENLTYNLSLINARTGAVVPGKVFEIKIFRNSDKTDISSEFTKTSNSFTVTGAKILEHKSIYVEAKTTV